MKKKLPLLLGLIWFLTAPASAENYATCLLDKEPEVSNDVAAEAVARACSEKHGGLRAVKFGSGRGLLGYSSSNECIAKEAAKTTSSRAAMHIAAACNRLYSEFNMFSCLGPAPPLSYECDKVLSDLQRETAESEAKKRAEAERAEAEATQAQAEADAKRRAAIEDRDLAAVAEEAYLAYPFLNHASKAANAKAIDEVVALRDAAYNQGYPIVQALRMAVEQVGPKYYRRTGRGECRGSGIQNPDEVAACAKIEAYNHAVARDLKCSGMGCPKPE